jgi:hypothetical protein
MSPLSPAALRKSGGCLMFKPSDFSDVALIAYLILSSKQPERTQIDLLREAVTIVEELTTENQ